MDWNKLNPEINYKGKHFKIGLVSLAATIFGIAQTPAAMVLLGVSAPTAAAIPMAVTAVVSIAGPIVAALAYVPKDGSVPPTTDTSKAVAKQDPPTVQSTLAVETQP